MKYEDIKSAAGLVAFIYFESASGIDPVYKGELLTELADMQQDDGGFGLVNDTVYAILALASFGADYEAGLAVDALIAAQAGDGGFSYDGGTDSDPDMTAMAISALSFYAGSTADIDAAIDTALQYIDDAQQENGGFIVWDTDNANSIATVVAALVDAGEDLADDRWNGILDSMMRFKLEDGSYGYEESDTETNAFATYQVLYALDAVVAGRSMWARLAANDRPAYDLPPYGDIASVTTELLEYVTAAYELGIMTGDGANFRPLDSITRAEFAKVLTLAMGIAPEAGDAGFADVPAAAWFSEYVDALAASGVLDPQDGAFRPNEVIKTNEAIAMFLAALEAVLGEHYDQTAAEQLAAGLTLGLGGATLTREYVAWIAVEIVDSLEENAG